MFSNTGYSGVRNICSKKSKRIYLWPFFFVFHWYNREHTVQGILLFFGNDGRGTEVLVRQLSDAGANKSSTADPASDQNLFSTKQFFSLFSSFLLLLLSFFFCWEDERPARWGWLRNQIMTWYEKQEHKVKIKLEHTHTHTQQCILKRIQYAIMETKICSQWINHVIHRYLRKCFWKTTTAHSLLQARSL